MITKEDIRRVLDRVPEKNTVLEKVYKILNEAALQKPRLTVNSKEWQENLKNFPPDFMNERIQPTTSERESLD